MNENIFETGVGFSIELIGWRLEYRGEHENLPLYECLDGEITAIGMAHCTLLDILGFNTYSHFH